MTLSGRFSALLLTALGLVLVGFSTALYVSARIYLRRQLSDRLSSALAILAAAAEVHPGGVEWEPRERVLPMGQDLGAESLRWMVFDDRGNQVDHSLNLVDSELTAGWTPRPGSADLPGRLDDRLGRPWRVSQLRIGATAAPETGSQTAVRAETTDSDPGGLFHAALVLTVAAPLGPLETTLGSLAWLLISISLGVWLCAAMVCRFLARRALAPLTRLAASARGLAATDPGWTLDPAGTGDELDDLGRAFNELLARLHLAFERQRRFGGDASHQLRTPLTILIGQLEVALRHDRSGEEYRRALTSALGRASELRQIVEALLFLARAEGEAQLPRGEPLDLGDWVDEYLASRSPGDGLTQVVHRNLEESGPRVLAHPPLLGQLLENLLDNAEKYDRPGAGVVVETIREGDSAVLAVSDSGPGISPTDLPHVFEPFYRSEHARCQGKPGHGLGLAVVQRIAVAFGGSVCVQNKPEGGCRIEVRFPRLPDSSNDAPSKLGKFVSVGTSSQNENNLKVVE